MSNEIEKSENEATELMVPETLNMAFDVGSPQIPHGAELPSIGISRETCQFKMPDSTFIDGFIGHILHYHHANLYYALPYGEGEAAPPDCCSSDGIMPDGGSNMQLGPCATCPYNEYGSSLSGRGKACANSIWLYVLIDGEVLPCLLKAPPSSLNKKDSLMTWLTAAPNISSRAGVGVSYQLIKTRFSLREKSFASGMSAALVELATVRVLNPTNAEDVIEIEMLKSLYKSLKNSFLKNVQEIVRTNLSEGDQGKTAFENSNGDNRDDSKDVDIYNGPDDVSTEEEETVAADNINLDHAGENPSPKNDLPF